MLYNAAAVANPPQRHDQLPCAMANPPEVMQTESRDLRLASFGQAEVLVHRIDKEGWDTPLVSLTLKPSCFALSKLI